MISSVIIWMCVFSYRWALCFDCICCQCSWATEHFCGVWLCNAMPYVSLPLFSTKKTHKNNLKMLTRIDAVNSWFLIVHYLCVAVSIRSFKPQNFPVIIVSLCSPIFKKLFLMRPFHSMVLRLKTCTHSHALFLFRKFSCNTRNDTLFSISAVCSVFRFIDGVHPLFWYW